MFIKCNGSLYNADVFSRIQLNQRELVMFVPTSTKALCVVKYSTPELAAYAYGRIIHGLLGKWGCVDASEDVIAGLLAKTME
jgi:hypothetical protein